MECSDSYSVVSGFFFFWFVCFVCVCVYVCVRERDSILHCYLPKDIIGPSKGLLSHYFMASPGL